MVRMNVALRTASPRDALEILETLLFMIARTRLEPGCADCTAWADRDATVHYGEGWVTEADARRRIQSDDFTSILSVMECASEPPRVQFDFVSLTRGLDFVEEVRSGQSQ
jgi:quinol monooxygenase YgiN